MAANFKDLWEFSLILMMTLILASFIIFGKFAKKYIYNDLKMGSFHLISTKILRFHFYSIRKSVILGTKMTYSIRFHKIKQTSKSLQSFFCFNYLFAFFESNHVLWIVQFWREKRRFMYDFNMRLSSFLFRITLRNRLNSKLRAQLKL